MTEYEKVEKLREKTNVTYEEARTALEAADWDLLEALVLLEKEGKVENGPARHSTKAEATPEEEPEKESAFRQHAVSFRDQVRKFIRICCDNHFAITRKEKEVLRIPVIVLLILVLMSAGWTLAILAAGLFFGLRYSLHGEQLGKPAVNDVMDKAANAAENVRETVEDSLRNGK